MNKVTMAELVERAGELLEQRNLKRKDVVEDFSECLLFAVAEAVLAGKEVCVRGFGKFFPSTPRKIKNNIVKTEKMSRRTIRFKPSRLLYW